MFDIAYPLAGFYAMATPGQWVVIFALVIFCCAFIGAISLGSDGGGFWASVLVGAMIGVGIIVGWTLFLAIGSLGFWLWNA